MFKVDRFTALWIIFGCLFVTSCSSKEVVESDIVGIWVEKPATGSSNRADCAIFDFDEDGTFKSYNFPSEYFFSNSMPGLPVAEVAGRWKIEKIADTQFIDLVIEPYPEAVDTKVRHSTINLNHDSTRLRLFAWAHDENERIYFNQQDAVECSSDLPPDQ